LPISRRVYKRRDGIRSITLPKSWVEILEEKYGEQLKEIHMNLFDEKIVITPKFSDKNDKHKVQKD